MKNELKRLLFTDEPFHDESFIGYIMRLSEMNEIPDIRWILQVGGLKKSYDYRYKFSSDFRVDTQAISSISGIDTLKIEHLLYKHEYGRINHIIGNILVFGIPIPYSFIRRENPKICPICLQEKYYLRKVWEISLVTVCPVHQCLLLDKCPICSYKIGWEKAKINLCRCGFDFRKFESSPIELNQLRLAKYLYQEFKLSHENNYFAFNYPLSTLSLEDLLRLIYFIATNYEGEFSGSDIFYKLNNEKLHHTINKALHVFDNWSLNYLEFIEWWKAQNKQYYVNRKQVYLPGNQLERKYYEYELFNYVLNYYLEIEKFGFMHDEFMNFLKTTSR